MIKSTLGAPFGGTICGGQDGLESLALRLMTPPNFGAGFGMYFPSIVVVALGEPGAPLVCSPPLVGGSAPRAFGIIPIAAAEPSSAPHAIANSVGNEDLFMLSPPVPRVDFRTI